MKKNIHIVLYSFLFIFINTHTETMGQELAYHFDMNTKSELKSAITLEHRDIPPYNYFHPLSRLNSYLISNSIQAYSINWKLVLEDYLKDLDLRYNKKEGLTEIQSIRGKNVFKNNLENERFDVFNGKIEIDENNIPKFHLTECRCTKTGQYNRQLEYSSHDEYLIQLWCSKLDKWIVNRFNQKDGFGKYMK